MGRMGNASQSGTSAGGCRGTRSSWRSNQRTYRRTKRERGRPLDLLDRGDIDSLCRLCRLCHGALWRLLVCRLRRVLVELLRGLLNVHSSPILLRPLLRGRLLLSAIVHGRLVAIVRAGVRLIAVPTLAVAHLCFLCGRIDQRLLDGARPAFVSSPCCSRLEQPRLLHRY
jgi:hypothetical protein